MKVAQRNGLTLGIGFLAMFLSFFFGIFFGIIAVLFFIALFTAVFFATNSLIAGYMRKREGPKATYRDVLIVRLYRFYVLPTAVLCIIGIVIYGIPPIYTTVVLIGCAAIYLGRYLHVRGLRRRLPPFDPERQHIVTGVGQITGVHGIVLKTLEKVGQANMMLLSWKHPVMLITGLARENLSDDQITAVMLHEIGHFLNRDPLKKLAFLLIAFLAPLFFFVTLLSASILPGHQFLLLFLAIILMIIFLPWIFIWLFIRHSRRCEYRADSYCASCGYGKELISALETMHAVNGFPSTFPEGVLFLHPDFESRKKRIEQEMLKGA